VNPRPQAINKKRLKKKEKSKGRVVKDGKYEGKVPYQGREPNPAVQYLPKGDKPVELDKAKDEDGKYVPYEGPEPNQQVQYDPVPQEEHFQHQSFMNECIANTAMHADTEGLDENRAYMSCAIAYDKKYQTSYAPCGPLGCIY